MFGREFERSAVRELLQLNVDFVNNCNSAVIDIRNSTISSLFPIIVECLALFLGYCVLLLLDSK